MNMLTRPSRLVILASMLATASNLIAAPKKPIVVTTAAELAAALVPANEGARIHVVAGEYVVTAPLTVPDDATLEGEGVMTFDAAGRPSGFAPAGRTVIRADAALAGDVLTLGDGVRVRNLSVEDAEGREGGNPVIVASRGAGDFVSARIENCEIVNPNPSGIAFPGPTGRALAVVTRNPNLGMDPPPHEGAVLRVGMTHSIVRSPAGGDGVFAINFASHAEIDLDLSGNVIGGPLQSIGGVGRPNATTGARVTIQSDHNLYRPDSIDTSFGWLLFGGADAPSPVIVSEASTFNSLQIHSRDDAIEGFAAGISAVGARRAVPLSQPSSSNLLSMNIQGLRLSTELADLALSGAQSLVDGVPTGDDNVLRVLIRQSKGSGPRSNDYSDSIGGGTGNRLELVGSSRAFAKTNTGIDPPPPAEFFESQN
jgi:hypothetical protein